MNIQISGHNIDLTEALKQHVHKKAEKLAHHFSNIIALSVVLTVEREQQIAEANISVNHYQGHATAKSTDMYLSIDDLFQKLERQLEKQK